jgi:hypothetical protein
VLKGKFASYVFQSCKEKVPKMRKLVSGALNVLIHSYSVAQRVQKQNTALPSSHWEARKYTSTAGDTSTECFLVGKVM